MNDSERGFEAFRATEMLCKIYERERSYIIDKFARGTKFPYFQRFETTDDKGNVWHLVSMTPSKEYKKKRKFINFAYTLYDIPPKRGVNPINTGKGAISFDPVAIKMRMRDPDHITGTMITDLTPHAINRYTMRYLTPNGKDYDIHKKIESIMFRWLHFDVCADMYGDKNTAKHKDDGISPVDVYMKGGGMFRGNITNGAYMRLNTYVSDDMMFDNQIARRAEIMKEYHEWKRLGIIK